MTRLSDNRAVHHRVQERDGLTGRAADVWPRVMYDPQLTTIDHVRIFIPRSIPFSVMGTIRSWPKMVWIICTD